MHDDEITSLTFVKNHITDMMFSKLLDCAYAGRHPISAISTSWNEFGPESVKTI